MRARAARPPPLALLMLVALLPVSAATATSPLLLVARSACRARDPSLFSQTQLERYATISMRFSQLSRPYRLLGFEETCGEDWETAVTRNALAVLGAGGAVVSSGRLGTTVCSSLSAATRILLRPQPAACSEVRARGAAVVHLAAQLHWKRALISPAEDASECAAALLEVERALVSASVLVRRMPIDTDDMTLRPHVIILCDSSLDVPALPDWINKTEVLLIHIADPRVSKGMGKDKDVVEPEGYTTAKGNSLSTPESVSQGLITDYFQSVRKMFSFDPNNHKNEVNTVNALPIHSDTKQTMKQNLTQRIKIDEIPESYNITRLKRRISSNIFFQNRSHAVAHNRRKRDLPYHSSEYINALFVDMNKSFTNHLLILSDEFSEINPIAQSLYDEILEATLRHVDAERTKIELTRNNFFLYKSDTTGGSLIWTHMATFAATSRQPLGRPQKWVTNIVIDLDGELELKRRSAMRISKEVIEMKTANEVIVAHLVIIMLCVACAVCGLLTLSAACARRAAARRTPRRPRAVPILASADFQFPADERRRVGEGMETMLSWLQQFHEFGGQESVQKVFSEPNQPDLLKRPEPLGQSAPSSTCSVTRLAPDNRTRYKGDPVHMKYLPAATLELRRKTIDLLLVMQSLRHENLNPFIGCLTEVRPALVFEACGRGSLEDVLIADDIRLDWTFRLSLLTDLVRGMRYLHSSPIRVHARLTSRNCVVDSRWVLRITDYGLPTFTSVQALPYPPRAARDLLWTAPELLREIDSAAVPNGTQPGDVFSFAIIMQEVIMRGEPYCMLSLTPEEILDKLRHPPPLIRPSVSMSAAPPEAVSVMRQCWSEQPDLRPDFNRLYEVFRHMHRGRKSNIVDSMFEMLEKYSNNLEELIKERTEQLDMEKKKTEQLLNRMLPSTVAERLMMGLRVEPEEFEEVSIYFSDIVGFTALAARSTPVQVVDLLNDLYTTFDAAIEQYRVYKVETIGDAYMVVGGLPIRSNDHAENIATMALHLLHLAGRFRIRHLPATPLHLRIGLHTGACCAGVVGLTMPRYCLFGDTVNTASRMESTGVYTGSIMNFRSIMDAGAAWRIQISSATAERLVAAGGYRLRSRGLTQVKGKGAMHTYWLLGKEGFDKPLPTPPALESEEVLFEAEGENESEMSEPQSSSDARSSIVQSVERQRSDPSPTIDKFAWQRSGAVSAESSPPALSLPRCRYLRSSVSTVAGLLDTPRLSDRWIAQGARVLRRQWSLERGDALAAAAAEIPAAALPQEPLALRAPPLRAPPPRYRTRRDTSTQDISDR